MAVMMARFDLLVSEWSDGHCGGRSFLHQKSPHFGKFGLDFMGR